MNGRERVRAAIAREPVDRVPLGFYAVDHDTIERVIGRPTLVRNKIQVKLALAAGRRDEVAESFKKDTLDFYRKIDCADLILAKGAAILPPVSYEPEKLKKIEENQYRDARGRIWKADLKANDIMCIHDPAPPKQYTVEDFEGPLNVSPPDPSIFEALDYLIEHLGEERYICSHPPITALTTLGNFEDAMLIYAMQPELIHAANKRSLEARKSVIAHYIRPGSAGAHISQDMAGTNAPFISPSMFRDMCLPYFKESIAGIKQHVKQVNFHNCGYNIPLMDMFIEAGVDCYQSLQTTAGMEIGKLKCSYGDRMAFWGGMPLELLIGGTTGQVRKAVREAMERGAPGGGFILGPSHSIAKNTKYENFMAMLDEYVKLRDKF